MKNKSLISIIVAFIMGVMGFGGYQMIGGAGTPTLSSSENLVGSSATLGTISSSTSFSDSVTATAYYSAVDQLIETSKLDYVFLNIKARGANSTSTLFVRQMGSQNGSDYFDISQSTTTYDKTVIGTTTLAYDVQAVQWDPGVVTTSISVPFKTFGYRYTRFIIWSDAATDGNPAGNATYAWIQAIKPNPLTR